MDGLIIPVIKDPLNELIGITKEIFDNVSKYFKSSSILQENSKVQTTIAKKNQKQSKKISGLQETYFRFQNNLDKKTKTIREKLYKVYDKYIVKGKFFEKIGRGIASIVKGIAKLAGNWFIKLITFLLLLAVIDPKGKLLGSLINFFVKIAVWFIQTIARMLPKLVRTMVSLVREVLPKLIISIISSIFPALENMFRTFAKELEKNMPFVSKIFNWIADAFSKDGALYKFGMFIAKISPIIFVGFLALGGLMRIMGPLIIGFKALGTIFGAISSTVLAVGQGITYFINPILTGLFKGFIGISKLLGTFSKIIIPKVLGGLKLLSGFILNIFSFLTKTIFPSILSGAKTLFTFLMGGFKTVLTFIVGRIKSVLSFITVGFKALFTFLMANPIVAIIAGIALAFVAIYKWSDKIVDIINFIPIWLEKKLGVVGKMIGFLFKLIFAPIKALAIFFSEVKKKGIKGAIKWFFQLLKEVGKTIYKGVKRIFGNIVGAVFTPFKKIFKIFTDFAKIFEPAITAVSNVLKKIWDFIKGTIMKAWHALTEGFFGVVDYVTAVASDPLGFLRAKKEERRTRIQLARASRVAGLNYGQVLEAAKGETRGIGAEERELGRKVGSDMVATRYEIRQGLRTQKARKDFDGYQPHNVK